MSNLAKKAVLLPGCGIELSAERVVDMVLIGGLPGHSQSIATAVPA